MKNQRITLPDDHRVLQFRPRDAAHETPTPEGLRHSATILPFRKDMPQVEHDPDGSGRDDGPDDFRHRLLTSIAALGLTVALTAVGFWIATSIADMRRTQDCVMIGRRDCAPIPTAPR